MLAIIGVGLILVGVVVGRPEVGVEGAYFTRATGAPRYSSAFRQTGTALLSPQDGNLWIGAGLACCLVAVVLIALSLRARRTVVTD
jgi:hypothetical protein